mmetsp:Transcript_10068/g.12667  ORF Transcript_10068/g.12667 Transcript_10068/m.12667 type:complete len:83 (+) Transcript_10068:2535-2783(+)
MRDTLLKIAALSPEFSISRFLRDQRSFKTLVDTISPEVIKTLNTCFIETANTRKFMFTKWPKDLKILTFMSSQAATTMDELE